MPVTSVVIDVSFGRSVEVLGLLARVPGVTVYGIKDSQIVTVIEGGSAGDVEATVGTLQAMDGVVGVYPVYSGEYE